MIRPGVRRLVRLFRRTWRDSGAAVEEEIALHLQLRIEQLMRQGVSAADARAEAYRKFGDTQLAWRRLHRRAARRDQRMRFREWLGDLASDVRFTARTLVREPRFTAVVVVTLALGTGANAAMFGVVDRLLLRGPEHVIAPEQVLRLYMTQRPAMMSEWTSPDFGYVEYALQREHGRGFDVAAYTFNEALMGRGESARDVNISHVTADLFGLLGVQPLLGRFFTEAEDTPAGEKLAVIGHALWHSEFNGRRDAIGRTVAVGSDEYTVIGVAPKGFTGVQLRRVDLWLPMSVMAARVTTDWKTAWDAQWLKVIARLEAGVTPEQAQAEATATHRRGFTGSDDAFAAATMSFLPLVYNASGKEPGELAISRWLVGVSIVVLLIACANVTNLLLARTLRRKRDIGVRLVLGISRRRLGRMLLLEGLALAAGGALLGLVLAHWGTQVIRLSLLPDIEWTTAPINRRVLFVSAMLALATAVLISLLPLVHATRTALSESLKSGAREGGGRRGFVRSALTVAEAALAVVLLVGAGLFVKSLTNVRNLDLGIEPDRVTVVSLRWPRLPNPDPETSAARRVQQELVYDQAIERLRRLPGVSAASSAVGTPFNSSFSVRTRVPGRDTIPSLSTGTPKIAAVSPGYFETVGTPLRRGRAFTSADVATSERVALVNTTMAATVWPDDDAIGKCLLVGNPPKGCTRVVGVVSDARRFEVREEPSLQYYIPISQNDYGFGGRLLLVRPRADAPDLTSQVRRAIVALDPSLLYVTLKTLQDDVDPQIRPWRLGATMFALFGLLALIIALIGLYSLISYLVSSRVHELGVRMALGARTSDIVTMVLRQATSMTGAGIVIGVLLALLIAGRVEGLLFDVSPRDPPVIIAIAVLLLICAVIAGAAPARRAACIDPATSLRAE